MSEPASPRVEGIPSSADSCRRPGATRQRANPLLHPSLHGSMVRMPIALGTPKPVSMTLRVLMLVLTIVSVPSVGLDALQRPHCVQHDASAVHAGHAISLQHTSSAARSRRWTRPSTHECPHCPASECSWVSPCTGSTSTALSPTAVDMLSHFTHRVGVKSVRERADSAIPSTDTPPPQAIA